MQAGARLRDNARRPARNDADPMPDDAIQLNGQPTSVAPATTIEALLRLQGLAGRRVAVEVNGCIVPRGQHATHVLWPGDRVEIVHALGGG